MLTSSVGSQASDGATADMAWSSTALEPILSVNYRSLAQMAVAPASPQVRDLSPRLRQSPPFRTYACYRRSYRGPSLDGPRSSDDRPAEIDSEPATRESG